MSTKQTSQTSQEFAEIGKILAEARKEKGLSIEKVAARIHIRKLYLRAIESGDVAALPGGIYTVGFIKVYSKFLDLDAEEMIRRIKVEDIPLRPQAEPSFKPEKLAEIFNESNLPSKKTMLISAGGLLAILLAVIGWNILPKPFVSQSIDSDSAFEVVDSMTPPKAADNTSALGVAPQANIPGTVTDIEAGNNRGRLRPNKTDTPQNTSNTGNKKAQQAGAAPTNETTQGIAPSTDIGRNPSGNLSSGASEQPPGFFGPADASSSVSGEAPVEQSATQSSADTTSGQTVLKATQASWIRVRDSQNQIVVTKTLQLGEEYVVPQQEGLTLHTGNAGGLDVFVGGQRLGPLGAPAQIVRKIDLGVAALKKRVLKED